MPLYRYKAKDLNDQDITGIIQAASQDLAADLLADRNLTLLTLEEEKTSFWESSFNFFNRVKRKELVMFSRQLSTIISANVPLVQGLKILVAQTTAQGLKTIISEIADDVEGGATLSSAMGRHTGAFDDFFINIIRAGETSGKLDESLIYLADQMERDYDLVSKIKGAMYYPAFIVTGLGVVGAIMMIVVLPKLTETMEQTGMELPLTTKILIAVSTFMAAYWWILLIVLAGLIVGFMLMIRSPRGRYYWHSFLLLVPIVGQMYQEIVVVRFARSLSTLTTGGVTLTKSLEIVADVVGSEVYKKLILETAKEVEDGNSIATVFLKSREIPVMVSQMLSLGEKTGRLDEILGKVANFYSREVNNKVANMMSLLEPVIMIVLGVAVAIVVSAVMLPMYNMAMTF